MKQLPVQSKFVSRKYIMSLLAMVMVPALPVVYQQLKINDQITMTVIGFISATVLGYCGFNYASKKVDPDD